MGGGGWLKTSEYRHIIGGRGSKIAQKTVIWYLNVPLSALPRPRHNHKRTCGLVLHTIPSMLNVKQGSCEYQLTYKVFWLIRRDNRTKIYRPRGERSNH